SFSGGYPCPPRDPYLRVPRFDGLFECAGARCHDVAFHRTMGIPRDSRFPRSPNRYRPVEDLQLKEKACKASEITPRCGPGRLKTTFAGSNKTMASLGPVVRPRTALI